MKKNDLLEILIDDLTNEGNGVGHIDGMAVFVPNSAIGDRLIIKILKVKKNYAYGKIESIIEPSCDRIQPDCKHFPKCGGCTLRHISYDAELHFKHKRVSDCIRRIGGLNKVEILPIVRSENIDYYRNKSQIPVGKDNKNNIISGFFSLHSHRLIKCDDCKIHPPIFNQISEDILDFIKKYNISTYDEFSHSGILRHIYIRIANSTNQIMVCLVINNNKLPYFDILVKLLCNKYPNIKSIVLNVNTKKTNVILGNKCITIFGNDFITDELCGLKFNISPLSFYQVNRNQAEVLYNIAKELACLNKNDILLDLYCGTGTIGLSMANKVKKLIGIEIIEQAVNDAKKNAVNNNINNAEFICSDADTALASISKREILPNIILVDPPRKGCSLDVINFICKINPEKVIYVSCDPSTLARDLKIFNQNGIMPIKAIPVDMFPRTCHVETVVLLSKI